jgi:hypothetical protein
MGSRGAVAEWLGRGLQSPVHRFDSGPRLFASLKERAGPPIRPPRTDRVLLGLGG